MKIYSAILACAILAACEPGNQNNNNVSNPQEATLNAANNPDADFAMKAAEGGLLEVQLRELAQTKGVSPSVKNFGKMMADDHRKANEELKALAQTKNIQLPASLYGDKQEKYNDFVQKSTEDFDKAYAEFMVKDHKKDIEAFEDEAEDGKDAELKNWAAGKLPVLRHHLDMAEQMEDALENKNNP